MDSAARRRYPIYRMSSKMRGLDRRHIFNLIFLVDRSLAVVDIFKPHWIKAFIKPAQVFPHVATSHKKRAGRLFHRTGLIEVAVQITVASVHRIGRPQAIDAEEFKDERGRCGQTADGKSRLCTGIRVDEFSGGKAVLAAGVDERVNPCKEIRVWIQQEQEISIAGGDALIDGGGESTIFAIREKLDVCPLPDLLLRQVARSVIDDDRFHVGSHPRE